jgi:toxin ParE1/3/4
VKLALRVRPEAEQELLAAAEWYEERKPGLGVELVAAVDEALLRLAENPLASPVWKSGLPHRRYPVRRFPYVIFFVLDNEAVEVVAIAHVKRWPGYWQRR